MWLDWPCFSWSYFVKSISVRFSVHSAIFSLFFLLNFLQFFFHLRSSLRRSIDNQFRPGRWVEPVGGGRVINAHRDWSVAGRRRAQTCCHGGATIDRPDSGSAPIPHPRGVFLLFFFCLLLPGFVPSFPLNSGWLLFYQVWRGCWRISPKIIWFYRVLLGFTGFLPNSTGFYWVLLGFIVFFLGFCWMLLSFYRVLLGFTGFYPVLLGFTEFYWVLQGFTGFFTQRNWIYLGFIECDLIFIGLYLVVPSFTEFYRVLPGFTEFFSAERLEMPSRDLRGGLGNGWPIGNHRWRTSPSAISISHGRWPFKTTHHPPAHPPLMAINPPPPPPTTLAKEDATRVGVEGAWLCGVAPQPIDGVGRSIRRPQATAAGLVQWRQQHLRACAIVGWRHCTSEAHWPAAPPPPEAIITQRLGPRQSFSSLGSFQRPWIFIGHYRVLPSCTEFRRFYRVVLGLTGLFSVITEFYRVLNWFSNVVARDYLVLPSYVGSIEFYWVLLGFTGFYWVLLGFGLISQYYYKELPSFTELEDGSLLETGRSRFHQIVPGFTGFSWWLPSFTEFSLQFLMLWQGITQMPSIFTEFYRVLLRFHSDYRVLPSFSQSNRMELPSFTEFPRWLPSFFLENEKRKNTSRRSGASSTTSSSSSSRAPSQEDLMTSFFKYLFSALLT